MIRKTDIAPPKDDKPRDNMEQRKKDITESLYLKVGECGIFNTFNIKSWKAIFYSRLKTLNKDWLFTFKKSDKENEYSIWRIK